MIEYIYDENKKDSFALSRQAWRWVGSVEVFRKDLPQIRHSCDVHGVSYLVNGTTLYLGARHESPHMLFDVVVDTLKRYFPILGRNQLKLTDERTGERI